MTATVLAAIISLVAPLSVAVGPAEVEGQMNGGDGNNGGGPPPCVDPVDDVVDKCGDEPANNACDGAVDWGLAWSGTSTGNVGPTETDPSDWSRVQLYRTETLVPTFASPSADPDANPVQVGTDCSGTFRADASFFAKADGPIFMHVPPVKGDAKTAYTVGYSIKTNDAFTGGDVGNDYKTADPVNAVPESADEGHNLYQGALPIRPDQVTGAIVKDEDWYRIHADLGPLTGVSSVGPIGTNGVALGLLTVYFNPGCNGGSYYMQLYKSDGTTTINDRAYGCGSPIMRSCIATGATPVYAQVTNDMVTSQKGTGYEFSADLSPVYIVNLDDGIHRTYLDPTQPWCDDLTPIILGLLGEHLGVVNAHGEVIASVNNL